MRGLYVSQPASHQKVVLQSRFGLGQLDGGDSRLAFRERRALTEGQIEIAAVIVSAGERGYCSSVNL